MREWNLSYSIASVTQTGYIPSHVNAAFLLTSRHVPMKKMKRIFLVAAIAAVVGGFGYLMWVEIPAPTKRTEAVLDTHVYIR